MLLFLILLLHLCTIVIHCLYENKDIHIQQQYKPNSCFFHRCPVYGHLPSTCRLVIKQNECCGQVSCKQHNSRKLTNYYQNYFHFFFTVILLLFMDFFRANFRGFCVSLKSQNIMSNKIQISTLLFVKIMKPRIKEPMIQADLLEPRKLSSTNKSTFTIFCRLFKEQTRIDS